MANLENSENREEQPLAHLASDEREESSRSEDLALKAVDAAVETLRGELSEATAPLKSAFLSVRQELTEIKAMVQGLTAAVEAGSSSRPGRQPGTPSLAPEVAAASLGGTAPPPAVRSIKGVVAADYYLDYKRRGGAHLNLDRQDLKRAELVVAWLDAMATPEERASFADASLDRADRREAVRHLTELVKRRFYDAFADHMKNVDTAAKIPPSVRPGSKEPGMNWIADRIDQLKKLQPPVTILPNAEAFADFRQSKPDATHTNKRPRIEHPVLSVLAPPPQHDHSPSSSPPPETAVL